ncbi:MAG: DUF4157 domain-containing protein [Drouetiella hepatica Uher 2000/2452]|uniref:DUF4157 domain-containing protein n=1 Tax=Drouetiella hepatica Uher 2000/2452 TaxID=904376 RepID=A0A951UNC6_9CYAN|nr:DUF4157 domain-containing protein [Drouetiella hepatica Uher 2000/2452]
MSARSLTKVTNATQADAAAKTSLLKHSGVKPIEVEPKRKPEEWAKQNSEQKSCFKQDFSRVPVSPLSVPVIQPKLVVGRPGDRYEQEADQVAEQVMLMPEPAIVTGLDHPSGAVQPLSIQRLKSNSTKKLQRQVEESEESEEEETVQAKFLPSLSIHLLNSGSGERIQRQADELQEAQADEEEPIQAKFLSSLSSGERLQRQVDELQEAKPEEEEEEEAVQAKGMSHRLPTVASDLASRLKASRGGGQPLPDSTREFMESRFNHDFSRVRVHTDGQAHQLARGLNAQAFTFKQDVYFGAGYYQPHTSSGKRLLAHELTHTIQQQDTLPSRSHKPEASPLVVTQPPHRLEHEAESVEHQVTPYVPFSPVTVSEGVSAAQNLISLRRSGSQATRSLTFSFNASVTANVGANLNPFSKRSSNENANPESEVEPEAQQASEKEDAVPIEEAEVEEAEAAKSDTAEKDAAKSDETLADTTLPEDSQQTPTSPEEDPAFQATLKQIDQTKRAQRKHSPPDTKLGEIEAAAVLPENEQKDKNDRKQHLETIANTAEAVDQKKEPFKPETFKQLLQQNLKEIEKNLPQDEAGAREFKDGKPLKKVKENIGQQVASENEKVAAPITGQVKQDPPGSKISTKAATALQEEPVGSKPRPIDPQAVAPKPKHDSEISMEEESQKLDAKLSENKMTEEQLENSGEDKFTQALGTKRQAQQEAKAAPERYRQEEEKDLAGAEKKAQGAGKEQFGGMVGDRQEAFDTVHSKQKDTEKASVDKQKEVFKGLEKIYNDTKNNVGVILTGLSEEVDRIFSEESEQAKKVFEDTVEEKLDDIYGFFRFDDALFGEDTEAIEQVFQEEKNKFLSAMDKTLDKIANLIATKLNEAIQSIEQGRLKSEELFNGLDKEQQEKSSDAMELFRGQYNDLETSVNDKQQELAQTLAESYKSNVDSLRETFDKIYEEVKKSWIEKAIEFIEEVASAIANLADLLLSILQRIAALIGDILAHPIRFLENLAAGVKAGFGKFIAGIEGYLAGGFVDWLRGSMGGARITIPDELDPAGIFSLVTQVLGLGYDTFWTLATKILGKEEVELLKKGAGAAEKGLEIFQLIQGKGLIALWDDLKETIASSFDGIINQVKETVIFETVKKALAFIGLLFTPVGAFIKAVQLLYKGLRFLVDNIDRIRELVNAFMDSVEMAVRGDIGGIASRIVTALQNFIVLAIDFLAKLLNLGDLAQKVRKIFQAVRKPIERAIEWLLKKVKPIVKRVFKKGKALVRKAKKKVKALVKKAKKKAKAVVGKIKKKLGIGKDKDKKKDKAKKKAEKQHAKIGKVVVKVMSQKPSKDGTYEELRKQKEEQAKGLETKYNQQLEQPVKLKITFKPPEQDKKDTDLDFHVHIGPNDFDTDAEIAYAVENNLVLPIYRGIHFLKAENHTAEDEKKYEDELKSQVGEPTFSAAALELAESQTFDGSDVKDKKVLEEAVKTVKVELKKKESKGESATAKDVTSWWKPKQPFNSEILVLLQRYINTYGKFKKELKEKKEKPYKGLSFSAIPFISTSWRAKHPIKYALGASLNKELQPRRRQVGVAGRVSVYLFSGKELQEQNAANVRGLQEKEKISINHRKLHQDEVAFTGGIPGKNLVKQHNIVWDISPVSSNPKKLDKILTKKAIKLAAPIEQDAQQRAEAEMQKNNSTTLH